jgi:hypothetical protein
LIRYSRDCDSYHDFLDRGLLLTRKLLNQGFLVVKLKTSPRQFTVNRYGVSVKGQTTIYKSLRRKLKTEQHEHLEVNSCAFGRVVSSCSTCDTCRVDLVTNPMISLSLQLIRYFRACDPYHDFLDRGLLLTRKLLNQGFLVVKSKSSLRK